MRISLERIENIINALQEKGGTLPCSRCGKNNFTTFDGYINNIISQKQNCIDLSQKIVSSVPAVAIICDNCGNITQHALGALGLMDKEEEQNG